MPTLRQHHESKMNRVFTILLVLAIAVTAPPTGPETRAGTSRNRTRESLSRSKVDARQVTKICTTPPGLPNLECCWSGRAQEVKVDKRGCQGPIGVKEKAINKEDAINAQRSSFLFEALAIQEYMRTLPNGVAVSCSPRIG
ncbi:hypothetical protein CONLIGDRAFT_300504 [Coniochaeta ligniaria NRRL 30616]|uniref:Hydrophobin n=1 Tax=Coniochaeta ligniaria NRRL 30616 TaxID=1408157 RepID=A0A1J7JCR2_9PEZI|nr:hypothetical protein CONLIGDRAFT_300504 [Coniochaeta ligniaria NRRL 30616]